MQFSSCALSYIAQATCAIYHFGGQTVKIVRKFLIVVLAVCCIATSSVPAFAAEVQPRFQTLNSASATLNIKSGGQAECLITARTKTTTLKIDWTITLRRVSDGTTVGFWSASGNSSVSVARYCSVEAGYDYQVIASFNVKDSSGNIVERHTEPSCIVSYR